MSEQISMLREAYDIETKYMADQIFRPVSSVQLTKKLIEKESSFDEEEMNAFFRKDHLAIYPSGKKGGRNIHRLHHRRAARLRQDACLP